MIFDALNSLVSEHNHLTEKGKPPWHVLCKLFCPDRIIHDLIPKYQYSSYNYELHVLDMYSIMPEIHDKNKLSIQAAPTTCSAGKLIRAKEFLACFRQDPDDLHLMRKFSLSPKQLRRVCEALIEKGLITEFEYNHRGIASDGSESLISGPNPKTDDETDREGRSSEIRGMEPLRGQIHESRELISNSAVKIDSLSRGQTSCHQKHRTILFDRPGKRPLERPGSAQSAAR